MLDPHRQGLEVPEETARLAHTVLRKGNPYVRLRDTLGVLYEEGDFAPLLHTGAAGLLAGDAGPGAGVAVCREPERPPGRRRRAQARPGGLRRSRYVGQAKAHLQHVLTAVALNLPRLARWFAGLPRATTRTSTLMAFVPAPCT